MNIRTFICISIFISFLIYPASIYCDREVLDDNWYDKVLNAWKVTSSPFCAASCFEISPLCATCLGVRIYHVIKEAPGPRPYSSWSDFFGGNGNMG